jgi:TetR/AcrR family transcriptional regulator, regulator of mycofactocin system
LNAQPAHAGPRTGRPPRTSAARLADVALALFAANGFDETTIEDVAEAAGIGRRTFFRYFASKNDLVWGAFDDHLDRFRGMLRDRDRLPMTDALREAVVEFNRVPDGESALHRRRMRLILTVPALQAHSTLRYRAWRDAVEEFVVRRTGEPPGSFRPRLLGHLALAASVAAYEQWLAAPGADLGTLIDAAYRELPDLSRPAPPTPAGARTPPAPTRRPG